MSKNVIVYKISFFIPEKSVMYAFVLQIEVGAVLTCPTFFRPKTTFLLVNK